MACFRTDFVGRGELADRQQKLGVLMARLRKLAEEFNVAVFITNHVMSDPSGELNPAKSSFGGSKRQLICAFLLLAQHAALP